MSRGYVQPISKKQALSYERLVPNGIGVTTLAAVNGRGAAARAEYDSRYQATREILTGSAPRRARSNAVASEPLAAKPNRSKKMPKRLSGAAFKRSAQYKKMMSGLRAKGYRSNKGKAKRAVNLSMSGWDKAALKSKHGGTLAAIAAAQGGARAKRKGHKRPMPKGAFWKSLDLRGATKKSPHKKVGLLKMKIGGKVLRTYMVRGKGGKVRHVPDYMLTGFKSGAARASFVKRGSKDPKLAKRFAAFNKREANIQPRRVAAAERALARARAGRVVDIFTPNAMSYSEWSKNMTPNKKRAKKKAKKSGARRPSAKRAIKRVTRRAVKRAVKRTSHKRKARRTAKQIAAARRNIKKAQAARRRGHTARKGKAKSVRRASPKRRAVANRRRHHRNGSTVAVANRRHRRHRRNGAAGDLFMTALAVSAGFATHRALRTVLVEQVFGKIDALNPGLVTGADATKRLAYSRMLASATMALVGAGALQFAKKGSAAKQITEVQGGMVASALLDIIVQGLKLSTSTESVAGYLSGLGEYVPTNSGPLMRAQAGYGSYYPMNGMGAYRTAMAGNRLLGQASAGVGEYFAQNIAGLGQYSQQAAAGMGEFFSPGGHAGLTRALPISGMDDGIAPRLSAAEHALTVAEAVAGLGDDDSDTTAVSTVDAWQVDVPVTDPDESSSRQYGSLSPFVSDTLIDYGDAADESSEMRTGVLAGGSFG